MCKLSNTSDTKKGEERMNLFIYLSNNTSQVPDCVLHVSHYPGSLPS